MAKYKAKKRQSHVAVPLLYNIKIALDRTKAIAMVNASVFFFIIILLVLFYLLHYIVSMRAHAKEKEVRNWHFMVLFPFRKEKVRLECLAIKRGKKNYGKMHGR